jgi:hypothetical protein
MLPLFVQGCKDDGTYAAKDGLIVSRLFETSSFFGTFLTGASCLTTVLFPFGIGYFFLCLLSRETNKETLFAFNENKMKRRGEECSFYGNDKNQLI